MDWKGWMRPSAAARAIRMTLAGADAPLSFIPLVNLLRSERLGKRNLALLGRYQPDISRLTA